MVAGVLYTGCLSPAEAQNPTCPTRPPGDSSNACASTAFVQGAAAPSTIPISKFGAKCDGVFDNHDAIQNTWNYAATQNLNVWLGDSGQYCKFTGTLTMPPPTAGPDPLTSTQQSLLTGPGASQVTLQSNVTGSTCAINVNVTYGVNSQLRGAFRGFGLINATSGVGNGLCFNGVTQAVIEDVSLRKFNLGFQGLDTIALAIRDSSFLNNVIDIYGSLASNSPPNAWELVNNSHFLWQQNAIKLVNAAGIHISGGAYQSGGTNLALSPATIWAYGNPANGTGGFTIDGKAYFEGNQGQAEFLVEDIGGTLQGMHSVTDATFLRNLTTLTNIILNKNSGATEVTTIKIAGNAFYDFGAAGTPNAGRQFIAAAAVDANVMFNCGSNINNATIEMNALCGPIAPGKFFASSGQFSGYTATPAIPSSALANTSVAAGSYGSATSVATFTVNAEGQLTAAANATISGVPPGGTAGGDLTGTYPNPTLLAIISAGGPIGSATVAPIITYDAKGRLTAVSSATITPAISSVTGLGTGVSTALGINVGSAGAFVTFNGVGGTPSSITLTNGTGLPASVLTGTTLASGVTASSLTSLGTITSLTATAIGSITPGTGAFTTLSASTSVTSPLYIGGSGTTQSITYKTTTGVGASGADHIFQVGNNGATIPLRIYNSGAVAMGGGDNARVGQLAIAGDRPAITVAGTTDGTASAAVTQTINSTAAVNAVMQANEPGRTTSRWGLTIGNWSEFVDFGGSTNGAIFGVLGNSPMVFGTNSLERGRFLTGFTVGSTTDPGAGKINAQLGFVAGGTAGITKTCTIAVGQVLIFTLGILTATSGTAGCV